MRKFGSEMFMLLFVIAFMGKCWVVTDFYVTGMVRSV